MKTFFKVRTIVATIPLAFCLLVPCSHYYGNLPTLLGGSIIFCVGLAIRIWAQQYLGYRIPKKYRKAQRKKLVTNGPYSVCRNPVYVGNILIIAALPLLAGIPKMAPISFAWCFLTYNIVVKKYEEPHLMEKFGSEYVSYIRQTPRWLPRLRSVKHTSDKNKPFPLWLAFKFEIHNIIWTFPFIIRHLLFKP